MFIKRDSPLKYNYYLYANMCKPYMEKYNLINGNMNNMKH